MTHVEPAKTLRTPCLEARGLTKVFTAGGRSVTALDGVDLVIRERELVTVVGPSGCGKTTLLNAFAGFDVPTEGQVLFRGDAISKPGPERAVVFQNHALFPWISVRDNIAFGLRMAGAGRRERAAAAARYAELVGLNGFLDSAVWELSGGMQQRVGIARALANDPSVLLMDESFGALDALTREQMQLELLELWRTTHRTLFFITHSVDEAVFLGTRVIVMAAQPGRVRCEYEIDLPLRGEGADPREVKSSIEYLHYRDEILRLLMEAA